MVFDAKRNSIWSQGTCFKAHITQNQNNPNYFDFNSTLTTTPGHSTAFSNTYFSLPNAPYILVDPILKTSSLIVVNATQNTVLYLSNDMTFGYLYSSQSTLPASTLQYYANLALSYTRVPNVSGVINYINNTCHSFEDEEGEDSFDISI